MQIRISQKWGSDYTYGLTASFTLSVSISVDRIIVNGSACSPAWIPRAFHQVRCLLPFPEDTSGHTYACARPGMRAPSSMGASWHVTGQGNLIQSWSQTTFQDFPGHRPIPGIPFQAGAGAGAGAGAWLLLLLTPPAGGQGSRKRNRAWSRPVGIPETGVGGDQDRPELPPLAPLPCCLMGYKGESPQTGRQMRT